MVLWAVIVGAPATEGIDGSDSEVCGCGGAGKRICATGDAIVVECGEAGDPGPGGVSLELGEAGGEEGAVG